MLTSSAKASVTRQQPFHLSTKWLTKIGVSDEGNIAAEMHSIIILVLAIASASAVPISPAGAALAPAAILAAAPLVSRIVAGSHGWSAGPQINTVAAWNSGNIAAANVASLRASGSWNNAHAASWNDANMLARQINQANHNNRNAAIQAARDQAAMIRQLELLSHSQRINQGSRTAQESANQAALRQATANQATAAQLNAINGGATRASIRHQADIIGQVAAVNSNAAIANSIKYPLVWNAPAVAVQPVGAVVGGGVVGSPVVGISTKHLVG